MTKELEAPKKIKNREMNRSNGASLFKYFSEDNLDITANYVKNIVKEIENTTFNKSEPMSNFEPTTKRHQELNLAISK